MTHVLRSLAVLLLCSVFLFANDDLRFADSCYAARAERANGDKADAKNAALMIDAYKKAMSDPAVAEAATTGYLKSVYFAFRFVHFDKSKRKEKLDSLKTITESAYNKYPNNAVISDIYLACISLRAADMNPIAAVKEGIATTVHDVAAKTKNYQVLGRAHQVVPHVPLLISWPDKDSADYYLNKALAKDSKDLYNYLFLAELRFDQKRYADALELIDRALARGVRTNYFLEDKRGRWQLKELQKKINAKLDKK